MEEVKEEEREADLEDYESNVIGIGNRIQGASESNAVAPMMQARREEASPNQEDEIAVEGRNYVEDNNAQP